MCWVRRDRIAFAWLDRTCVWASVVAPVSVGAMRAVGRILSLVLVVFGVLAGSAIARTPSPLVLHLKWRLVATGPTYVTATDRYAAIVKLSPGLMDRVTLIDEQAHTQRTVAAPNCPWPNYPNSLPADAPMLAGPWLMFGCGIKSYQLYDLATGRWVSFAAAPQCGYDRALGQGPCIPVNAGSAWVKFLTTDGACEEHCEAHYYLQNIRTGEFKLDPVTPGGTVVEALNAPSGSRRLCSPLRYPRSFNGSINAWEPGSLTFYGRFALATGDIRPPEGGIVARYRLHRCGTALDMAIYPIPYQPGNFPGSFVPLVASCRALIWIRARDGALVGRFFPTLQQFRLRAPAGATIRPPQTETPGFTLTALTKRTIYITTVNVKQPYADANKLWAAPVPQPPRP